MALHGWRLYGVVLIIFAYIVGILVLSVINMQGPQVTFPRSGVRFEEVNVHKDSVSHYLNVRLFPIIEDKPAATARLEWFEQTTADSMVYSIAFSEFK